MTSLRAWLWDRRHAIVFLTVAAFSATGAARRIATAIRLAPLDVEERRTVLMGQFYTTLREIDRSTPRQEPLTVVLDGPNAIDHGVAVNYYLYPRRSFNYFAGQLPPDAPRHLLVVDGNGRIRRTTVRTPRVETRARADFLVPFVAAAQGSDSYATEAAFESDVAARVTLTLLPQRLTRTYPVLPGRPLIFGDLVYEAFGRMETGWLRVTATAPVRGGFWFVSRGQMHAAPVRTLVLERRVYAVAGGERLWLLNTEARAVEVSVNGATETLEPYALRAIPAATINRISSEAAVFAFATSKTTDGNTEFHWPEDAP